MRTDDVKALVAPVPGSRSAIYDFVQGAAAQDDDVGLLDMREAFLPAGWCISYALLAAS